MENNYKELEALLAQRAKINSEIAKARKKQPEKNMFYIYRCSTGKLILRGATFDFWFKQQRFFPVAQSWDINDLLNYGEKFGRELLEFCRKQREEQE